MVVGEISTTSFQATVIGYNRTEGDITKIMLGALKAFGTYQIGMNDNQLIDTDIGAVIIQLRS